LGRSWTFDDLEEQTAISAEVHRSFYHVYTEWCSTVLFKKYVTYPTFEEAKEYSRDYELAGFPGCIGSGDGTHVMMHRCPWQLIQFHESYKLGFPARNYNVFVNHRRKIMASTKGQPAKWNDQTTIKYDTFAKLIAEWSTTIPPMKSYDTYDEMRWSKWLESMRKVSTNLQFDQ